VKIYKSKQLSIEAIFKMNPELKNLGLAVEDSKRLFWDLGVEMSS
jgi:hypothetical protein